MCNKKIVLTSLTVLWVCFIWGNSLLPGSESQELSLPILYEFNNLLRSIGSDFQFTHFMVRKMAHFSEYAILGVLLFTMFGQYICKVKDYIFNVLFFGLLTPVLDEFIQLFIDGRGGEIRDVIIDFSGVLTGIILVIIITKIIKNIKLKRRKQNVRY